MALYEKPLACGGELLVEQVEGFAKLPTQDLTFDVVIVGSGYGGSVAAARLSEVIQQGSGEPLSVCVLERGDEHLPGRFPGRFADLPKHVRINRFDTPELTGDAAGLFDLRVGADVSMLLGNGLGGGSLINAGVAEVPDPAVFHSDHWPEKLRSVEALKDHFATAARMLGVQPADVTGVRKYREFASWAEGLGIPVRPANITVSFGNVGDNGHGVEQKACIKCGDCFTGCNHHAKNTLPMNYLARARRNGACLYTGITVLHVTQTEDSKWSVCFRLTPRTGALGWQTKKHHRIVARHVVLAAGAMGSTEILKRSEAAGLSLSKVLGSRFSCNGDMISGLYAQDCRVNASPTESSEPAERKVGPTITGIARRAGASGKRLVLEELAIPSALRRVFEEVVTAAALPYALGAFESALLKLRDPAAVDPDAVDRTQVFAAMGEDQAKGRLEMIKDWDQRRNRKIADGVLTVEWPCAGKDPVYQEQDDLMSRSTANGGDYLRSPLWQPLPPEMAETLDGEKPKGKLFTVHPLGGCPMADSASSGVVNDKGQVFRGVSGDAVYPNLLVLDGSIVPSALGINPLLTISALAERAMSAYIEDHIKHGWRRQLQPRVMEKRGTPEPLHSRVLRHGAHVLRRGGRLAGWYALADHFRRPQRASPASSPLPTGLRFAERVHGDLKLGTAHVARLTLQFNSEADVPGFLRNASRQLRIESGELALAKKPLPGKTVEHWTTARVSGGVVLLKRCRVSAFERTFVALNAFLRRRGIADWLLKQRQKRGGSDSGWDEVWGRLLQALTPFIALAAAVVAEILCLLWPLWRLARRIFGAYADDLMKWIRQRVSWLAFVALAYQIGEKRRLSYRLRLDEPLQLEEGVLPEGTHIVGTKIVRYTLDGNPWKQVFELPLSIRKPWHLFATTSGTLKVDLGYFFRRYAVQLQVTQQQDLPSSLVDLSSVLLFLLRIVGKIHFWSFRLPEYQKHDPDIVKRRTPGELEGLHCRAFDLPLEAGPSLRPKLKLTHYWKKGTPEQTTGIPVVLFHGLGASGNQFATPKLDTNLVQHLAGKGRDVWVAEMRHSIALPDSCSEQWSLDAIALGDVPRLISKVRELASARKIDVVAHCIGSAMFCIAALDGRLRDNGQSVVNAAVLMQVGPLITLSDGTKIRAYLAAFLRRYMKETMVDFSIDDQADWLDALIDRVLVTYPYPASEEHHHELEPPWKQHLHLANCNRWAAIDGRMIQHDNLDDRMLNSLGEILGPANLTTWEQTIQYAYLERLTDAEACNSYVTDQSVKSFLDFPVRFIHGEKNDVFAIQTSERSRDLLKRVHGADWNCDVKRIPGYSHLDPLIGKEAYKVVYPKISEFLEGKFLIEREPPPPAVELQRPLLGPIVGWTRKDAGQWTARLWCRVDDSHSPAPCVLVAPLKNGEFREDLAKVVRTRPGRIDTLATIDVVLEDDADYELFVVSLHGVDRKCAEPELMPDRFSLDSPEVPLAAEEIHEQVSKLMAREERTDDGCTTDPEYDQRLIKASLKLRAPDGRIRFALASCRYGASVIDRERADAMFGRLRGLVEADDGAEAPSLLLLVGDQIYADQTAGAFDPGGRRERFYEAYREAWGAPNARAVLSRLPTYMMMDDHEVGDNWHPKDKTGDDDEWLRYQGLDAFQEYQLLHSPWYRHLSSARLQVQAEIPPEGFSYEFEAGGFPFFVFDTRTGRKRSGRIMAREQMDKFRAWLDGCDPERPKFVVSPSVVVPYREDSGPQHAYASRSDGWDGYPESLRELFAAIWERKANNVVFLCGDAHLSMAARISLGPVGSSRPGLDAYCVVSSALYAPFPFANSRRSDYLPANGARPLGLEPEAPGIVMHYQTVPEAYLEENNFNLVEAEQVGGKWRISVVQYAERWYRTIELTSGRSSGLPAAVPSAGATALQAAPNC